jgi:integrase
VTSHIGMRYGLKSESQSKQAQSKQAANSSSSSSSLAYRQFVETCKSPATRDLYVKALGYFMKYLRLGNNDYDKLLNKDVKLIQMDICDFITAFKSDHSSAAVCTYVAAINKFYSMNDVILNWKKINSYQGERVKIAEDRPYTHSEIQTLIGHTVARNRAIILLMSSGGLRLGAIPILRIKDLEPVEKYNIYRINVYAKSVKSRYFTFCAPECRREIDSYIEYRKRWTERISEDSPVFRADYNIQKNTEVRPISTNSIRAFVYDLLLRTGLRSLHIEGSAVKRTHIMACHAARKFFETNAFKAGMDPMYIRRLMGQKSGFEDSYLKLGMDDLLEGDSRHIGYIGIIDQLTIDESQRLRRENQKLRVDQTSLAALKTEVENLKALINKD